MKYDQIKEFSNEEFRRLTGVKRNTFEKMVEILTAADQEKKSRGGRKSKLSIENRLLMALEYIREYRAYFHVAASYGLSESVAYKTVRWVEDTLIKDPVFALPGRKALLRSDMEYEVVLIDASESPIERPKKKVNNKSRKGDFMHQLTRTWKSLVGFLYVAVVYTTLLSAKEASQNFSISEPYIWLEDSDHEQTQQWLEQQKDLFESFIQQHPEREKIKERVQKLANYAAYSVPMQMGDHLFFTCRLPSEEQAVLYVQSRENDNSRPLINPNQLSSTSPIALADYVPSPNGQYLAYGLMESGSDWITWKVLDIATGENQGDQLERIKFIPIAWTPDSLGFYYSCLDQDGIYRLYYHRLGTAQASDEVVNHSFESSEFSVTPSISSDSQYLMLNIMKGSSGPNTILYRSLSDPKASFEVIVPLADSNYSYICNKESLFYFWTNEKAPLGKVIAIDQENKNSRDIIKEGNFFLDHVRSVGDHLVTIYLENVASRLFLFDFEGKEQREIHLPELGQAALSEISYPSSKPLNEFFFSFTHFAQPSTIYRYSLESHQLQLFKKPELCFNPSSYLIRQVFCISKDGTKVPLFIVHRKDLQLEEAHPTLLYGYGGFCISVYPHFNSLHMAWMESGGIFALANIRGGCEYGEAWHKGGMRQNKQNCFDDFIAAAEWLIANRYTTSSKLAIRGQSNGGLLTAVCLNQRPDLFGAGIVGVGVLDMLRFHLFTVGHFWMTEYGNPDDSQDRAVLLRYSPYHNIQKEIPYPSILITTGDHDDRVVPLHSYKYAAAMQEAQKGEGKILLRVDRQAGHGAGKSLSQWIEEATDILLFLNVELK